MEILYPTLKRIMITAGHIRNGQDHPKLNNYAFQKLRQDLWKKIQTCEPSTQWDDIKLSLTPSHIDGDITLMCFIWESNNQTTAGWAKRWPQPLIGKMFP